ncbi:MAG TPA: serine hydrolase [Flavobacteriaceae bacterium]
MKNTIIALLCFGILNSFNSCVNLDSKYSEKVKKVNELLESSNLGKNYNGAILIADGEKILFQRAYGFDASNKKPNEINSKYGYASIAKMFTATAIMQLRENEQISLEQTIGEILSEYPNNEAKNITVQQLLSHTSGLGDFHKPAFFENMESAKTLKDYLPFFANDSLKFKPGEKMWYSNAGYIVLGLMIEEISGTDYNSYIAKNIFQPTGMVSTGPMPSSAGGGESTVFDLHKFALALKDNKLVSKESFASMISDHFNNGYGYGMVLGDLNGKKIYGHNGGSPYVSAVLEMVLGEPLIIVTMSNRKPMDGTIQIMANIRKEFFGSTPEIEQFLNTERVVNIHRKKGIKAAGTVLEELKSNISGEDLLFYAEKYKNESQPDKAVDLMKLMIKAYPDKWSAYSSLADFQFHAGYNIEAIKNYKKSLILNPKNEQAIKQLKQLEQRK